jgi:hypothetical protein
VRSLLALNKEFEQSKSREFRASETSVVARGIEITDEIAQNISSVKTISALDFSSCRISVDGLK